MKDGSNVCVDVALLARCVGIVCGGRQVSQIEQDTDQPEDVALF